MPWFLILNLEGAGRNYRSILSRAKLTLEHRPALADGDLPADFRSSPVFPLTSKKPAADLLAETSNIWHLDFFAPTTPFRTLGRIVATIPAEDQAHLWFSLGYASILALSPSASFADSLATTFGESLGGRETWIVTDGILTHLDSPNTGAQPQTLNYPKFSGYSGLPCDLRGVLDEFVASLHILLDPLVRTLPDELVTYEKVAREIEDIVSELLYLHFPGHHPLPDGLRRYDNDLLIKDAALRVKLIQQLVDRVVQMNSALSYVTAQLFSGTPPILERRALIRRYSLLGVGSAVRGLTRLARHVDRAFASGKVEAVIHQFYAQPKSKALPGLLEPGGPDSSEWESFAIDELSQEVAPVTIPPKVIYFSGRLGFREAEYAVSAALQALWAGDTVEWSFSTLTHELLHGHVRNILSQIFTDEGGKIPQDYDEKLYSRFSAVYMEGTNSLNTLDSIRFVILHYCCLSALWGSLSTSPSREFRYEDPLKALAIVENDLYLPLPGRLWRLFERQYKNISEIFVHVLDFHYFYRSNLKIYLPFVWRAWGTVPSVRRDTRQYALRSLLTAASQEVGTPKSRFDSSLARTLEALSNSSYIDPANSSITEVRRYLQDPRTSDELLLPFQASLGIVDLARKVFFSPTIRSNLVAHDPLVKVSVNDQGDEVVDYGLSDFELLDQSIRSPTMFLLARLRQALGEKPNSASERRAAWIQLALTSTQGD